MKRINMLIGSLGNGGAEGVCITLANGFVDHGYDVYLIVLNLDNSVKEHLLDQRINLVNLKKNPTHRERRVLERFFGLPAAVLFEELEAVTWEMSVY